MSKKCQETQEKHPQISKKSQKTPKNLEFFPAYFTQTLQSNPSTPFFWPKNIYVSLKTSRKNPKNQKTINSNLNSNPHQTSCLYQVTTAGLCDIFIG